MNTNDRFPTWAAIAVALVLSVMAGSVHAMFTPYCDRPSPAGVNKLDGVTPAFTECQNSIVGPTNDSEASVNAQEFFDPMGTEPDWVLLSKQDTRGPFEDPIDIDLVVDCDGGCASDTGTWSFNSDVWDTYADVMIVLKGSNEFSGYLLESMVSAGTWNTGGDPLLSHLTVYARGDAPMGGGMPEPTTLSLIAFGLIGAGYSRKHRSK